MTFFMSLPKDPENGLLTRASQRRWSGSIEKSYQPRQWFATSIAPE